MATRTSISHTIGYSADALCNGAGCHGEHRAHGSPRSRAAGLRLCRACHGALVADLSAVPAAYAECERQLAARGQAGEKVSGGGLPGFSFNVPAAEARTAALAVLASWSALVAEERRVRRPQRNVRALAAFLSRHADWLAAHEAAAEASQEVARVTRHVRRAASGEASRRIRLGRCVEPGCAGELVATMRPGRAAAPARIACSGDPGHQWAGDGWLQLGRRLDEAAAGGAGPSAERWLTAADISRLWGIAMGSVYRLASEDGWRRRGGPGRVTYYAAADVSRSRSGAAAS